MLEYCYCCCYPGYNTGVGSHSFLQGHLPNPGIESWSPTLQADSLPSEHSLVVQWLRLCTSTARGTGLIPDEGSKLPHFMQCSKKKKKFTGWLVAQTVKSLPAMQTRSLGQEDPLEKGMATHSSILAWRIPWTEEPCKIQSMESQRVRHD